MYDPSILWLSHSSLKEGWSLAVMDWGGAHRHQSVRGLLQRDRKPFILIFTPWVNLESLINLTYKSLEARVQRERLYRRWKNIQALHRKASAGHWIQTQDLAVRQQRRHVKSSFGTKKSVTSFKAILQSIAVCLFSSKLPLDIPHPPSSTITNRSLQLLLITHILTFL